MCPVDICNPHFKDEHPDSVRLRRSLAMGGSSSRGAARFVRHGSDRGRLFTDRRPERTETLMPPSRSTAECYPRPPNRRDRFPWRPVKNPRCHDPGHLPSPSGSSRALGREHVDRARDHQRRSPSPVSRSWLDPVPHLQPQPKVASLGQTLLDDFCNRDGTRAHQQDPVTSHAPRWLAIRCRPTETTDWP